MRLPKYLSPTSLGTWERDREQFYMDYLTEFQVSRTPQVKPMVVGSAFDAFVKSALHADLFGKGTNPMYNLEPLLEAQISNHEFFDWGRKAGEHVFMAYKYSGAYASLLAELEQAAEPPRFEFTLNGEIGGVPLRGKPDCQYVHKDGAHVILDWKVSGYCGKRNTSPKKLYSMVRDGQEMAKPSRNDGKPHKGYKGSLWKGVEVGEHYLEDVNPSWADQLAIYGWMLGEEVGTENLVARIDQIACKGQEAPSAPLLRVAQHRARISSSWQKQLLARLQACWTTISSDCVFTDMTPEESQVRCELLDMVAEDARSDDDPFWQELKAGYRG